MEINFGKWNVGAKIIFIAACVAVLSLFMTWADIGIARVNGFQAHGYLFLILYIYPLIKVLKNSEMKKLLGIISSVLAVVVSLGYILSNTVEIMESTGNISSTGAYLFLVTAVALVFGVIKYESYEEN